MACACYRFLDYITVEWWELARGALGYLAPIVRDLPPGKTLTSFYSMPIDGPCADIPPFGRVFRHVPSPLSEIFEIRETLRASEPWTVPTEYALLIRRASKDVKWASFKYRLTRRNSPEARDSASRELEDAYGKYQKLVLESELRLLERQVLWDRVVFFLQGRIHIAEFQFDSDAFPPLNEEFQSAAIPRGVFSWPLAL